MSQARTKLSLKQLVEMKRTWVQHSGALRYHATRTVPHARDEFNEAARHLEAARRSLDRAMLEEGAKQPGEEEDAKELS